MPMNLAPIDIAHDDDDAPVEVRNRPAKASAKAPLVMLVAPFMAFMAFMAWVSGRASSAERLQPEAELNHQEQHEEEAAGEPQQQGACEWSARSLNSARIPAQQDHSE
jgi:hypothetical protein